MKRRPVTDQAKLLFIYLLRSSAAALATENTATTITTSTTSSSSIFRSSSSSLASTSSSSANFEWATVGSDIRGGGSTSTRTKTTVYEPSEVLTYFEEQKQQEQEKQRKQKPQHKGYINVRLASRADVNSIQSCNLATLPENYNQQFYINHMRTWPELAIVAEHVEPPLLSPSSTFASSSLFNENKNRVNNMMKPQTKIVAYVLGKVNEEQEQLPYNEPDIGEFSSREEFMESLKQQKEQHEQRQRQKPSSYMLGHVTSLAVRDDYRRNGLASELMKQLHLHLQENYNSKCIGLHVRKSNIAATRLYEKEGYIVSNVIYNYYQDGEDAYYMKKDLSSSLVSSSLSGSSKNNDSNNDKNNDDDVRIGWVGRMLPEQFQTRFLQQQKRPWETGPAEYRLPRCVVQFDDENEGSNRKKDDSRNGHDDLAVLLNNEEEDSEGEHVISGTY